MVCLAEPHTFIAILDKRFHRQIFDVRFYRIAFEINVSAVGVFLFGFTDAFEPLFFDSNEDMSIHIDKKVGGSFCVCYRALTPPESFTS